MSIRARASSLTKHGARSPHTPGHSAQTRPGPHTPQSWRVLETCGERCREHSLVGPPAPRSATAHAVHAATRLLTQHMRLMMHCSGLLSLHDVQSTESERERGLLSLCTLAPSVLTRSRLNKSLSRRGACAALVRHRDSYEDSARSLVTRMRPDVLGPAPDAAPAAALGRPAVWPQPRFAVAGAAGAVLLPSLEDGSREAGRSTDALTCRSKPWLMLSTTYTATHAPAWGQVSPALRRAASGQRVRCVGPAAAAHMQV